MDITTTTTSSKNNEKKQNHQEEKDESNSNSKENVTNLVQTIFGGKDGLKERIAILKSMDGKDHQSDLLENDLEKAVTLLSTDMNENHKNEIKNFDIKLLESFGKTTNDLYISYLKWSQKEEEEEMDNNNVKGKKEKKKMKEPTTEAEENSTATSTTSTTSESEKSDDESTKKATSSYNVTKAKRRLLNFLSWISNHYDECVKETVTYNEFKEIYDYYNMTMSSESRDKNNRLVIWMKVDETDLMNIAKLPKARLTRFVYYWTTMLSLHDEVHGKGVTIVTNWNHTSLLALTKVIDRDQKKDLDRLSKGSSAIKMKQIYLMEQSTVMSVIMSIISFFLSKKIKKRFALLGNNWDELYHRLYNNNNNNNNEEDNNENNNTSSTTTETITATTGKKKSTINTSIFSKVPTTFHEKGEATYTDYTDIMLQK